MELIARSALAIAVAVAAAVAAAPAVASKNQKSVFQDDRLLIYSGAAVRERTLDELRGLGVDTIRANVVWTRVAPEPSSKHAPNFDAKDPAAYPAGRWGPYDGLVRGAAARGIAVLLTPTGSVPAWASGCGGSTEVRRTCRPSVRRFQRFVIALGRRYSGSYQGLPKVRRWSIWNEPNQGAWLTPQYSRRRGRMMAEAPYRYRRLLTAAIRGLWTTGHRGDQILLGETAPLGRRSGRWRTRSMAPIDFYRDLFCIDGRGRPLRGRRRVLHRCPGRFRRIRASGVAHHPYTRGGGFDPRQRVDRDEVTISSLRRLRRELDRAARRGRLRRRAPIYLTEFGFQTDPPDDRIGVPLSRQATWLNESDWIAWRDSRVRSVGQYELRDERDPDTFNTGLRFFDGRAKPSLYAYRVPIWVVKTRRYYKIWGQLRPAAPGARERVDIEYQSHRGGRFKRLRTVTVSNKRGYLYLRTRKRAGRWRLSWTPPGGGVMTSRIARPARR